MRNLLIALAGLGLALAIASACSSAAPTPTLSPTPSPAKEWRLEGVGVEGTTVTVSLRVYAGMEVALRPSPAREQSLRVYAGIDVGATLDGRSADEVMLTLPAIDYVFYNVTLGNHTVEARDVVGHSETVDILVSPLPGLPLWLAELVQTLENAPVTDPPASIVQYEYRGQTVYFLPQRCCDIFSDLYNADGNIIGHPDGGITGQGDGRVPDFFPERTKEREIWSDARSYDPSLTQVPAPIESVEVVVMESFPPQYLLNVVSGLPSGCTSFAGLRTSRDGRTVRVEMLNWRPSDPGVACTAEYRTVEHNITLGSDFVSGEAYTVEVNDVIRTFVAQ